MAREDCSLSISLENVYDQFAPFISHYDINQQHWEPPPLFVVCGFSIKTEGDKPTDVRSLDGECEALNHPTQSDYEALANFRYSLRRFMEFSTSAAQAEGLPPQQHQALLAIKGLPENEVMTVGLLAERLLIAPHTATELSGRLLASGYIIRENDPSDRRRQTLHLTEKAEVVMKHLGAVHLKEIREMAPKLIQILKTL